MEINAILDNKKQDFDTLSTLNVQDALFSNAQVEVSAQAKNYFKLKESQDKLTGKKFKITFKTSSSASEQDLFEGTVFSVALNSTDQGLEQKIFAQKQADLSANIAGRELFTDCTIFEAIQQLVKPFSIKVSGKAISTSKYRLLRAKGENLWQQLCFLALMDGQLLKTNSEGIELIDWNNSKTHAVSIKELWELSLQSDSNKGIDKAIVGLWNSQKQTFKNSEITPTKTHQQLKVISSLSADLKSSKAITQIDEVIDSADIKKDLSNTLDLLQLGYISGEISLAFNEKIKPGEWIKFDKAIFGYQGPILVNSVSHKFLAGHNTTSIALGLKLPEQTLSNAPFSHAETDFRIAVVVKNYDEQQPGRVQVKLLSEGDDVLTWARLNQDDAGKDRGWYFVPEKDDEVLIALIGTTSLDAIVLGSLHSDKNKQPFPSEEANNIKGLKTRSKMQFIFDDETKSITLQTEEGHEFLFDGESGGFSLHDTHGNEITSDDKGITVTSIDTLTVDAANDIKTSCKNFKLDTDANVEIKAKADTKINVTNFKVDAKSAIDLNGVNSTVESKGCGTFKSTGALKLESSGITKLAGSLVQIN